MNNDLKEAFENNIHLYFLAGDSYGVLANTLETINFAGFTRPDKNTICMNIRDKNNLIEEIVHVMKQRGRERGIHPNMDIGLVPCVVGRDKWKIGILLNGHRKSNILLEVLNNKDSKKFLQYMKYYNLQIKIIPLDKKNDVVILKESMKFFKDIGEDINIEEAVQNVEMVDIEVM